MKTNHAVARAFTLICSLLLWTSPVIAQPPPPSGSGVLQIPGTSDPSTASGKKEVSFYFEWSFTDPCKGTGDPCPTMGIWLRFTNTKYNENLRFHVCSMFTFAMPTNEEIGENRDPNTDPWERYCKLEAAYNLEKQNDTYVCIPRTGGNYGKSPSVNLHFGCQEVNLGHAGSLLATNWAIDLPKIDLPKITCIQDPDFWEANDFEDILLSEFGMDSDPSTWNAVDFYIDVLDGECDLSPNCKFGSPAVNVHLSPSGSLQNEGFANAWAVNPERAKRRDDADPRSTAIIEVGNWITMDNPGNYPASLRGTLTGAPAGSIVSLTLPANAPGTDSTISYVLYRDTVVSTSGCSGGTRLAT